MIRRLTLSAAVLTSLALGGCSHRLYLPGDGPFMTRAERHVRVRDTRVDPVQPLRADSKGAPPPCKFGGARCPPWERAWPAEHGVAPSDRVTDAGKVIPDRKASADHARVEG